MPPKPFVIYLSGLMGSGKSSIGPLIADLLPKCQLFLENVEENLYLKDFYGDMKKWSFHSRVAFLAVKAKIYRQILPETQFVIIDRGLFELLPYAQLQHDLGNLDDRDFQTYLQLYDSLTFFIPRPNLICYLQCSIDQTIERVKVRNRDFEQKAQRVYLKQGRIYYDRWFEHATADKRITIDTTNFTLISYKNLAIDIAKAITDAAEHR